MRDENKNKKQLIGELEELRQKVTGLEASLLGSAEPYAADNKGVGEELHRRNRDLEILNAITQALHQSLDLDEVYRIALDMTTALENVDMAFIYLVSEDGTEAVLQEQRNLPEGYMARAGRIPYPKGITWEIIASGQIKNLENIQDEPNIGPAGRDLGHHGALGLPITLEEKVIGVIWFLSYKERRFDEKEVKMLSSIGKQVAVAMSKAKLYAELAKRHRYENIVSEVTLSVHGSFDLGEVLENAVEVMSENIDKAENVAIYLVEGEEAVMKSHRGLPDWFAERVQRIPYPKGFTWTTIIEGKPRYVPDVDKDTLIGPAGRQVGTQSYVTMPISFEGKTLGCISINSFQKNAFDEEDLDMLKIVANQIEIAINNARQAEEQRKLLSIIEQTADTVTITTSDGVIEYVNPAFEQLTGYSKEEVLGKTPKILKSGEHDKKFYDELWGTLLSGKVFREVFINRKKTGELYYEEKTITPVKDDDGQISYFIATGKDITERRRTEEELQKAQKLESIGTLAGGIAHDFNNLLATILGNLSLAKVDAEPGSLLSMTLEEAEGACNQAQSLTHQLLSFAKGGEPIKELASVAEIMEDSAGFVMSGSNIGYELSIADGISTVEVDPGQISQVIQNIVINAKQAMQKYGIIKLSAENITVDENQSHALQEGEYVKITIEDEGEGIPQENLKKIFDPYFTTKQEGSGLGLATAYSIVDKHGGMITVDSEMGVGSKFDIYLPATETLLPVKEAEEAIWEGKGRILIMDDSFSITTMISKLLDRLGYEVDIAHDGEAAIELYKNGKTTGHPFDVVIMDLTIKGGMGGKEAMEKLLEFDPQAAAIVSSGYSTDPVMAHFGEYGFKGCIAKPYTIKRLSGLLHSIMAQD